MSASQIHPFYQVMMDTPLHERFNLMIDAVAELSEVAPGPLITVLMPYIGLLQNNGFRVQAMQLCAPMSRAFKALGITEADRDAWCQFVVREIEHG